MTHRQTAHEAARKRLAEAERVYLAAWNNMAETGRAIGSPLQHLLLVSTEGGSVAHWLDSHPTLEQRIRRIYGRPMGPLPLARGDAPAPARTGPVPIPLRRRPVDGR